MKKLQLPAGYEIPDDPDTGRMDASYLRTDFGLRPKPGEEPAELPIWVRWAHFHVSRSRQLAGVSGPMNGDVLGYTAGLARIAECIGVVEQEVEQEQEEDPPYSFMPEVEAGRVTEGQKVVVYWRNKDQVAHFLRVDGDRLLLLLQGSERRFRPDLVRHPKEDEFPEVAENFNEPQGVTA